jgi:hypothetical protein
MKNPSGLAPALILAFLWATAGVAAAQGSDWSTATGVDGDHFGWDTKSAGDVNGDGYDDVIVGAPMLSVGPHRGVTFVFLGSATGVTGTPHDPHFSVTGSGVGWSAASAGDVNGDGYDDLIIGAPGAGDGGAAYVFHGSATGLGSAVADWVVTAVRPKDALGAKVAGVGDVNGDGFDDVMVSAPFRRRDGTHQGAVYVFFGSETGLVSGDAASADWMASGIANPFITNFGISIAGAGDVNGDGFDDVLVGDHVGSGMMHPPGMAYVFLGSPTGPVGSGPETAHWRARSVSRKNAFARSMAGAGDLNGDGFDDIVIGASAAGAKEFHGRNAHGAVHVWFGSAAGLTSGSPATADWTITGPEVSFGGAVSSAGDTNRDGYGDLLVGTHYRGEGDGAVHLFLGSRIGPTAKTYKGADWTVLGPEASAWGGSTGAADVNGDGITDMLVGGRGDLLRAPQMGLATVLLGGRSPRGLPSIPRGGRVSRPPHGSGEIAPSPVEAWPAVTVATSTLVPTVVPPATATTVPDEVAQAPTVAPRVVARVVDDTAPTEPVDADPIFLFPEDGGEVAASEIIIVVSEIEDAPPGLSYVIELSDDPSFTEPPEIWITLDHTGEGTVEWDLVEEDLIGRFHARVRAEDDRGRVTPWHTIEFDVGSGCSTRDIPMSIPAGMSLGLLVLGGVMRHRRR